MCHQHTNFFLSHHRNGTTDLLNRIFPDIQVTPDPTFHFCLQFDCDKFTNNTEFLNNVSQLKRHILGGPLDRAFTDLDKGNAPGSLSVYPYRMSETLYICPAAGKCTVIFLVDFQDSIDKAMAKIFLQEFVEGQRAVRTAPPVSYSKEPPLELSSLKLVPRDNIAGFIAFSLEKRHVEGPKKENAITLLTIFRSYLHYHIKCAKTYLQMRMRKRVAGWLQVLNRAVPEIEKEKKTAGGKTFSRSSIV